MRVVGSLIRYNANPNDTNTGDCVKRSLSIALGLDYNEVGKQLNRVNREVHGPGYNYYSVYSRFLRDQYNINFRRIDPISVEDFADQHSEGVYILLTGRGNGAQHGVTSHMIALVNGDVYDSWNSMKDVVLQYAVVSGVSSDVFDVNIQQVSEQVSEAVTSYIETLMNKNRFTTLSNIRTIIRDFRTYDATMSLYADMSAEVPQGVRSWAGDTRCHRFVLKLNPRMSFEDNVTSLIKKTRQKIYDYLYNLDHEISAAVKASAKEKFNKRLMGSERRIVSSLPDWCWPYVYDVEYWPGYYTTSFAPKYAVVMEPLPDDPYIESRGNSVRIEGDTLREFRANLEDYKESFRRINYDY